MALQVNVRLNQKLLNEIDAISKVLHVSRSEWLRNKIAYAVKEETLHLQEAIALSYAKGDITKKELHKLLGKNAEDVEYIVDHINKGKKIIDEKINNDEL